MKIKHRNTGEILDVPASNVLFRPDDIDVIVALLQKISSRR
jgi:hypothetical protein